jgi:hypothetical protein
MIGTNVYIIHRIISVSKKQFEDTKGVIRIRKSKDRQHNDQKKKTQDKQRSTKHYT